MDDSDTEWNRTAPQAATHDPYLPSAASLPPSSSFTGTRKFRVLHLFSGPCERKDSLSAYLGAIGVEVTDCDIVNIDLPDQDILDDSAWLRIRSRLLNGYYDFVFAGPPCRSFSASRGAGPGPPVLRDCDNLYGFPKSRGAELGLQAHHFEQLRKDNLLAEHTAEACDIMESLGKGYCVEQPVPWGGAVTMFSFASFQNLISKGAQIINFDQCMYDGLSKKPTALLFGNSDFTSLVAVCTHPPVEQVDDQGRRYMAPHPSFVGRKDENGKYLTGTLAAYPAKLNCKLATIINQALRSPS